MNPATARAILRIASGLPSPAEAHAIVIAEPEGRDLIDYASIQLHHIAEEVGRELGQVYGDAIERAGTEDAAKLLVILAALHEAQERGEVPQ